MESQARAGGVEVEAEESEAGIDPRRAKLEERRISTGPGPAEIGAGPLRAVPGRKCAGGTAEISGAVLFHPAVLQPDRAGAGYQTCRASLPAFGRGQAVGR